MALFLKKKPRPTSPYLGLYKPQLGSLYSIFGRITLVVVYLFLLFYLYPHDEVIALYFVESYMTYSVYFDLFLGSVSGVMGILGMSSIIYAIMCVCFLLTYYCRQNFWSAYGGLSLSIRSVTFIFYGSILATCFLTIFVLTFI